MTAEQIQPKSVDDYTHPHWCDLSKCRPGISHGGYHQHPGTMLPIGASHVTTSLVRDDEYDYPGRSKHVPVRLLLEMIDIDFVGHKTWTQLEPDEARLLATVLNIYADKCESARQSPCEQTAEQNRKDNA
ncbi:hypothetical protein GCM10027425_12420 [Alteromonas gracilis]